MANTLTPKQRRFVNEYLIDFNATQAAIRAGFSKRSAGNIANEYLKKPHIQAELQKRQKKLQEKLEITQEKVLQELASIAFANGSDFATVIPGGIVEVIPTSEVPKEKLPAIAGIEQTRTGVKVKTHDKVRALEKLGEYLGLFESGQPQGPTENNLFDAINAIEEEDLNDISEVQQETEADPDMVEG